MRPSGACRQPSPHPLLETRQVGEEGLEVTSRQAVRRHFIAWFELLRIDNPAGQMPRRVVERPRRKRLTAGKMRKVRGRFGARWRATNGMAEDTRRGQKHLLPTLLEGIARRSCRVLLGLEPGGEYFR